jgi:hypothetical protein
MASSGSVQSVTWPVVQPPPPPPPPPLVLPLVLPLELLGTEDMPPAIEAALATALPASTMPAPQDDVVQLVSGKARAVLMRTLRMLAAPSVGLAASMSEITPLT